jgi:hypothetical protein
VILNRVAEFGQPGMIIFRHGDQYTIHSPAWPFKATDREVDDL